MGERLEFLLVANSPRIFFRGGELHTSFFCVSLKNGNIRFCRIPSLFRTLPFAGLFWATYFSSIPSTNFFFFLLIFSTNFSCRLLWRQTAPIFLGGGPRVVVSTAAFHARVRGSVPGLGGLKETKLFLPHPRVKVSIVGSLRDREVACSASDRQGSNFESCVWRTVSSQSSHHPQEVLLAQFSLYVHKGGLKPDSFHFFLPYFF